MGRRAQKVRGALVKMGRRRCSGVGIIIEVSPKAPSEMTDEERDSFTSNKPINLDYQACYSSELCALVHWFERPSEWENKQTYSNKTWVPLSWLRIIKKTAGEKNA